MTPTHHRMRSAPSTTANGERPEAPADQAPVGGLGADAEAERVCVGSAGIGSAGIDSAGIGDVLAEVRSARDLVAAVSQVPLEGAGEEALREVVAAGGRLRSAVEALLLSATTALEAVRAGAGRAALRDEARLGARAAARKATVGDRLAQMPNVADALARGELTAEHAEVLADTARRTSADAVNDAEELHQTAAQESPEVLRREAQAFAARWDPAGAQGELRRQRRDRSAALFRDDETGMGVLNARFDPISFALVRQAVEAYNDALWRLDGGRDGTPAQVRDNRQRLADSVFEMLTGRNALHTQRHPSAPTEPTANSPADPVPAPTDSAAPGSGTSPVGPAPGSTRPPRTGNSDANSSRTSGGMGLGGTAQHNELRGQLAHARQPGGMALGGTAQHNEPSSAHGNASPAGAIGSGDAGSGECICGAGASSDPPGRSVSRFAPSHAPNQLVIVADIGVIDGTDPHGRCDVLGAGPVPASILDTISPDTRITAALFGGPGQLLWLGRSRRLRPRRHPVWLAEANSQQLSTALKAEKLAMRWAFATCT